MCFQFRQFSIRQDRCAMKVGTDGVLLGAWANGGERILDIGTGTGLIAIMMAQRYPRANVVGVEIDADAAEQAAENCKNSPFTSNIHILHDSIQNYASSIEAHALSIRAYASSMKNYASELQNCSTDVQYDAIVSNPPFFTPHATNHSSGKRVIARHGDTLTYSELASNAYHLLTEEAEFSVVVPSDYRTAMDDAAAISGFSPSRICAISTKPGTAPKRFLLAYKKHWCNDIEESAITIGDEHYMALTSPFYL